jgi:hypothetical protein
VFGLCQLLQGHGRIRPIVISDGSQAKLLAHQIVEQLFRYPCAITVNGMKMEINSGIGSETEASSR